MSDSTAEYNSLCDGDEELVPMNNLDGSHSGPPAPLLQVGPAYGRDRTFWKHCFMSLVFGLIMGLVAYGYLEAIEKVQDSWWGEDYGKSKATAGLGNGKWIWVPIMTGAGFGVGVIKLLISFPKVVQGFSQEVQHQYVYPPDGAKIVLVSMASLMGGCSMGPEAALGSLGGGIAQFWSERRGLSKTMTEQHVINGMSAAVGPLFPSPAIAVSVLTEIGRVETMHSQYMRAVMMMGLGACASFGVFYYLKGNTYLPFDPLVLSYKFETGDQGIAALIGAISGMAGTLHIIIAGICNRLFLALSAKLPNGAATVVLPTIGGALLGFIAVAAPLTLGSGSKQTKQMMKLAVTGQLDAGIYFLIAFLKSLAFGISKASGFIGGAIFPLLFVGSSLGFGSWILLYDGFFQADYSEGSAEKASRLMLFSTCFMAAVPACVMPCPISLLLMVAFSFQLNAFQATPIFIACITSHMIAVGSGLIQGLLARGSRHHGSV